MRILKNFTSCLLLIALIHLSFPVLANDHSVDNKLNKAQQFHLQQAIVKINQNQLAHAWGDLAYVLCNVSNDATALRYMMALAPKLGKQKELQIFFKKAIQQYPADQTLLTMYESFLNSAESNLQ